MNQQNAKRGSKISRLPKSTKKRFKKHPVFQGLAVVLYITFMFGLILNNQSKLIEAGFDNARLENQIERLQVAITQLDSERSKRTNLLAVRKRAFELGLNLPIAQQILMVNVPTQDQVIVYDAIDQDNIKGSNSETQQSTSP